MSREKEDFRDNLERISQRFPGKEVLTYQEVCQYLGKTYKTVKKMFPDQKCGGVPVVSLAKALS